MPNYDFDGNIQALMGENQRWNVVQCPFCFNPITPFATAFRAETVFTAQDLGSMDLTDADRARMEPYTEKLDIYLDRFWDTFPNSEPENEYRTHAVLHALKREEDGVINNQHFIIDEDGFPYGMVDTLGKATKRRICPHCHNELPHEYGKYPVKCISVVGITSSGKTVFLVQFLKYIVEYLTHINMVPIGLHDEIDNFIREHEVRADVSLPQGNTADKLTLPLPINVQHKITGKRFTFVFYDVAGENCVKPDQLDKYGNFIKNADGTIMIIDPEQFAELFDIVPSKKKRRAEEDFEIYKPDRVVQAMHDAFIGASARQDEKSFVPVAIAISKSDKLKSFYANKNLETHIFEKINYTSYPLYNNQVRGLLFDDFRNLTVEIRDLLKPNGSNNAGEIFTNAIENDFMNAGYFAFSALNVQPVEMYDENGDPYYMLDEVPGRIRIEEPFTWLLFKMGIIPAITKRGIWGYKPFIGKINGGRAGESYSSMPQLSQVQQPKRKGLFSRKEEPQMFID